MDTLLRSRKHGNLQARTPGMGLGVGLARRQRHQLSSTDDAADAADAASTTALDGLQAGASTLTAGAGADTSDTDGTTSTFQGSTTSTTAQNPKQSQSSSSQTTPTFTTTTPDDSSPATSTVTTPVSSSTTPTTTVDTPSTRSTTTVTPSTTSSSTSIQPSFTTTTILSTSTSTPSTTSSASTSTVTFSSSVSSLTTSATRSLVTSIVTASAALSTSTTSSGSAIAANSNDSSSTSSNGPGAGTVVGIVAGALVGVVVLSGIIGYFFRTKCRPDKDEDDYNGENPFGQLDNAYGSNQSRTEMRRDSQLLNDDESVHQMSELGHGASQYSTAAPVMAGAGAAAAAGAYGLARAPTSAASLPGLSRADTVNPRPPTMIQRHYAAVNHSGGFQPGQIVGPGQFYPSAQINQAGPYPSFTPGSSAPGAAAVGAGMAYGQGRDLKRGQTIRENDLYGNHQEPMDMPARSGTPEYQNPQQYFHQAQESYSSAMNSPYDMSDRAVQAYPASIPYKQQQPPEARGEGVVNGKERARRTLSVRNGGLDGEDVSRSSIYGGM